jgi:endonuclease/exonuclease/phosphatase family metal-dependent hydrolase
MSAQSFEAMQKGKGKTSRKNELEKVPLLPSPEDFQNTTELLLKDF